MQSLITLGLHCAELLVNLSRDEAIYRKMEGRHGARAVYGSSKNASASSSDKDQSQNSILEAFIAWETNVLFIFKSATHWMFGLAVGTWYPSGICMFLSQICYLAILLTLGTLFGAFLAYTGRRGNLPSAFGHVQTIVDIVDEWPYDPYFEPE